MSDVIDRRFRRDQDAPQPRSDTSSFPRGAAERPRRSSEMGDGRSSR
jgi:hypothetical protein